MDAAPQPDDAAPWWCSIDPAAESTGAPADVTVTFDQPIPVEFAGYAWAHARVDEVITLIAARSSHVVQLDGEIVENNGYVSSAGEYDLLDVHAGDGGFGAAMRYQDGQVVERRFCLLDAYGRFDEARCAPMGIDSGQPVRVVPSASGYLVYSLRNQRVYEWSFDLTPSLVSEGEIGDDFRSGVGGALPVPGGALVFAWGTHAEGSTCGTVFEHRLGASPAVRDLAPGDLSVGLGVGSLGEAADGTAVAVLRATCLAVPDCTTAHETPLALLYRYADGAAVLGPVAIHLPARLLEAVVANGNRVAVVSETVDYRLVISQFDEAGRLEHGEVPLPLAYTEAGVDLGALLTAFAVAPDDFVVVYTSSIGPRIARFSIVGR